jgi:hypothetical protein
LYQPAFRQAYRQARRELVEAAVSRIQAARLQQLDQSDLPLVEKARLTVSLADAFLRAIHVEVLDQRLQALEAVLLNPQDESVEVDNILAQPDEHWTLWQA